MKEDKVRLGLYLSVSLKKALEEELKSYNNKNNLDLTLNSFILQILKGQI